MVTVKFVQRSLIGGESDIDVHVIDIDVHVIDEE